MKRVLIVKTSSLGDIVHTLPAVTEAAHHLPDIEFDWVVEQSFVEILTWHDKVHRIIPVALRQWRKQPLTIWFAPQFAQFWHTLREYAYDQIIDAQGLLKSALVACLAKGPRSGFSWRAAREPVASLVYHKAHFVRPHQHAIWRVKQLFSQVLDYPTDKQTIDYGINRQHLQPVRLPTQHYVVFLHGTTWPTKHWPENYWQQLGLRVVQAGYEVVVPWGTSREFERAQRLASLSTGIHLLPRLTLTQIAYVLARARAVVSVDTGLGHIAAALAVPTISLYGPTSPELTGTMGNNQQQLAAHFSCAPCLQRQCTYAGEAEVQPACFSSVTPQRVWERLHLFL